jgi:FAD/FMN-containing dehydrogenase
MNHFIFFRSLHFHNHLFYTSTMEFLCFLLVATVFFSDTLHAQAITTTTPPECRKLKTDIDWPTLEQWNSALPGVITTNGSDIHGPTVDYRLQAKSVADVQQAVRFARKHKIRLAVLTTGHDQQSRSDAGSGLLIDMSLFQGARVLQSYTPTKEGLPLLKLDTETESITLIKDVQAAVAFGPAVAGLPLNLVLDKLGLFTVTGGAGKPSHALVKYS